VVRKDALETLLSLVALNGTANEERLTESSNRPPAVDDESDKEALDKSHDDADVEDRPVVRMIIEKVNGRQKIEY
jgi:hypothetical protein